MPRSVVCISRASGAGGEEIGRLVASRLGFLYVDEDLISRAAARGHVDPELVADAERRKPLLASILDQLAEGGAALVSVALPRDEAPTDAVRAFIREAIHEVAGRGDTVIVAHAASHAVGSGPNVLRVMVTAPPETRAGRLAAADGLSADDAAKAIKRSDSERADYLNRFYGVKQELPTHYDLVINTDTLTADEAAGLVVAAATIPSS